MKLDIPFHLDMITEHHWKSVISWILGYCMLGLLDLLECITLACLDLNCQKETMGAIHHVKRLETINSKHLSLQDSLEAALETYQISLTSPTLLPARLRHLGNVVSCLVCSGRP